MGEGRSLNVLRTFCGIRDEKSSDGIAAEASAERGKKLVTIDLFTISYGLAEGLAMSRYVRKNKVEN